jgi:GNAT superfamily N-acetyltransferase
MIALRHRSDSFAPVAPLPELRFARITDTNEMSKIQGRDVSKRFEDGHHAYVAYWNDEPAAFGWVATRVAEIGELALAFSIPIGERYLWNFVTLPAFRGRGIYPRLLQWIIEIESIVAERFWIAYAPENHASGAGIARAGFITIAQLSFDGFGQPAIADVQPGGAMLATRLLGMNKIRDDLTDCWKCVRAGGGCGGDTCCCDYQQPEQKCAD